MNRNDWIFLMLIVLFVVLIAGIFIFAKIKADYGLIKYTNKNGEEFKFRMSKVYNTTLYNVRILGMYDYQFRSSPFDAEKVPIENGIEEVLNRPKGTDTIYITQDIDFLNKTDTDTVIAISEFSRILGTNEYGVYKMNGKNAFTAYDENMKTAPVTCANVSDTIAVIYVKEGEDKIYSENGCLIVQGTRDDIIKVGDRLAYYLGGVMPYGN